jgi:ketosteroid isomerase-like protein
VTTTAQTLLDSVRTATESRDAAALAALYAPDAEVAVIDRSTPPSSPRVLHGIGEVTAYLEDTCARETSHEVRDMVDGGDRVAHTVRCRYPDGTRVTCMTIAELRPDGRIARQTIVQAWDE